MYTLSFWFCIFIDLCCSSFSLFIFLANRFLSHFVPDNFSIFICETTKTRLFFLSPSLSPCRHAQTCSNIWLPLTVGSLLEPGPHTKISRIRQNIMHPISHAYHLYATCCCCFFSFYLNSKIFRK